MPAPGLLVHVDDRVRQAAGPAHDGRRAVAQRDHLALAARLEARRHQEQVGAGVDPAGQVAVEALDQRDAGPGRVAASARTPVRRGRRRRCPGRRSGRRRRRGAGARPGHEVEALLRVEPADHPEDRPGVGRVQAHPRAAGRPGRRPCRAVRPRRRAPRAPASVAGSQSAVSRPLRIPTKRSPRARRSLVEAHPVLGREDLAGVARAHGVDQLGPPDPLAQEVDPPGVAGRPPAMRPGRARRPGRAASSRGRRGCGASGSTAAPADDRVGGVARGRARGSPGRRASRGVRARRPAGPRRGAPRARRRPSRREAPGVVGVLAGRVAVERRRGRRPAA